MHHWCASHAPRSGRGKGGSRTRTTRWRVEPLSRRTPAPIGWPFQAWVAPVSNRVVSEETGFTGPCACRRATLVGPSGAERSGRGSNPQPLPSEGSALSIELPELGVNDGTQTRALLDHNQALCQLSYIHHGAAAQDRTAGLRLTKAVLCQLSYGGGDTSGSEGAAARRTQTAPGPGCTPNTIAAT